MPKFRVKLFLFLLAGATVYTACRKTDQPVIQHSPENQVTQFFSGHASSDPLVQKITQFVKRENEKYNFVEKLIKQIGYPHWDKAIVASGKRHIGSRGAADSAATIFIPFVGENQNTVNASLVITTSPSDTSFRFLCDWQYKNRVNGLPSTDTTAENLAALFMLLDNAVFGHSRFTITDSSLFASMPTPPGSTGREIVLTNPPNLRGRYSRTDLQTILICFYGYVCGTPTWCANHGGCDYNNCPTGACYPTATCFEFEVEGGTGGGGGTGGPGGTGGGSGGGNGGGWTPPNNPNPCGGTSARTEVQEGCGTGWVPTGGGSGSNPPPPEPVDSMLTRYSRAINNTADSIFQLSMNSSIKEEWGFPFVQKNNNVYAKRCTTIHNTQQVILDRFKDPGERIMGELHTHPDPSPNPLNRSAPSGDDLETFNVNSRLNYTLFVECGNVRYALVIENVDSTRAFLATHPTDLLAVNQANIAQQQPNYSGNWQNATQIALVQLLGNSTSCGIGFYISDATKTKFTKLN